MEQIEERHCKVYVLIHVMVENNKDTSISVLINHFLKFNDGASNLMMGHFNLTMEQLHHKIT